MKMPKKSIYSLGAIAAIVSVLVFTGCKKSGLDTTTVSFVNQIGKEVTLSIYDSKNTYASNTGHVHKQLVAAGETARIPGDVFVDGRTYYMDWYTADYYYNNWYNDNFPVYENRVQFEPEPGDNTYYLEKNLRGNSRKAFLNGESNSTKWIAVGAYLYSSNTGYSDQWNNLDNNERYREITVNKSGVADYTHRDEFGAVKMQQLQFMIHESEVPYIEFRDGMSNTLGNMTGGKLPTSTQPGYASSSTDTVMALFPDNEYIFMMLKQ